MRYKNIKLLTTLTTLCNILRMSDKSVVSYYETYLLHYLLQLTTFLLQNLKIHLKYNVTITYSDVVCSRLFLLFVFKKHENLQLWRQK